MRLIMKRVLWSVAALLAAALLLVLAWMASNWRDEAPQPWPEELTPRAMAVAPADNFFVTLAAVPAADGKAPLLQLPACDGAGCAVAWASAAPQWAVQRQANAALGAVCEAGTRNGVPAFAEPLPTTFTISTEIPLFQNFTRCSSWLLTLAVEASAANQPEVAVAKLAQSARLATAVLDGSQSLLGHMIALAVWNRHLQALQVVAVEHPGAVAALQALPVPSAAQTAAAQRRWVAHEASYGRGVMRSMAAAEACKAEVGFSAWHCRAGASFSLPNYSEQLFSTHWQQVLAATRDDAPLNTVEHFEQLASAPSSGLFGSWWHWRGTIAHILFEVARPQYQTYFARSASLTLSAQATALWLGAQAQPAQARPAWLAAQVKGTPLAARLAIDAQGQWQLRTLGHSASAATPPTRWPAWPA